MRHDSMFWGACAAAMFASACGQDASPLEAGTATADVDGKALRRATMFRRNGYLTIRLDNAALGSPSCLEPVGLFDERVDSYLQLDLAGGGPTYAETAVRAGFFRLSPNDAFDLVEGGVEIIAQDDEHLEGTYQGRLRRTRLGEITTFDVEGAFNAVNATDCAE